MKFFNILFIVLIINANVAVPVLRAEAESLSQEESLLKQIEELKSLRESAPEAYFKTIQGKRATLKREFQELKEKDPERFQQFLQDRQELKKKRLEYFRQNHPLEFQYFMGRRMERIHNMAQAHPERFQEFLSTHPQFQERYQNYLQKRNPTKLGGPDNFQPTYRTPGEGNPPKRPLMQHLDQVQNQNPEGFQRMMENRPRLQKRHERYQEQRQGGRRRE